MTLAQRALVLAIRGYRRWLSGRGPLRRVRCTFDHGHDGETCSAFGLRAAREAPSARVAWGRIQRRIRRCGGVALYSLVAPDGSRAIGWGDDHDRPLDELHAELLADGEHGLVRAQVLSAREVASRWRGDLVDVAAARALRGESVPIRPRLRAVPSRAALAHVLAWRVALAVVVIAGVGLLASIAGVAMPSPLVATTLAAFALLPVAAMARRQLARRARLLGQARSAMLRDPAQLEASLPKRFIVSAISAPRLHSTTPKPSR